MVFYSAGWEDEVAKQDNCESITSRQSIFQIHSQKSLISVCSLINQKVK